MEEMHLRRLVGQAPISRVYNEEKLAIEIVAKNPKLIAGLVKQMNDAPHDLEKKRIFEKMTRDEQLAFVFLALDKQAGAKVRDYLHRNL